MNVAGDFASEMNVELQGENIEKSSAELDVENVEHVEKLLHGGMGNKCADFFGG